MALQDLIINIIQITSLLFFLDVSTVSGEHGILSSIYRKAVKDNRPLILVLDNESHGKVGQKPKSTNFVSSSEYESSKSSDKLYQLLSDSLLNLDKRRDKMQKHKKDKTRAGKKTKKRPNKKMLRVKGNTPMPAVIASLLRISNDLRCAAQEECQEQCPAQVADPCEQKCEEKFDCDQPKEDKCAGDECAQDFGSTKGILLEPDEPVACPRC